MLHLMMMSKEASPRVKKKKKVNDAPDDDKITPRVIQYLQRKYQCIQGLVEFNFNNINS